METPLFETPMILDSLNPAQQEAVRAPLTHQLILAGAGSGKTRVLTHRMAWLVNVEKIAPFHILAVTFTNKAANEMRARIESMLSLSARNMWLGTFHGLSHRFLRKHWEAAHLPEGFQILDSDDQLRLIRRTIAALNLDEERYPPKEAQWFINAQKEEGREPQHVPVQDKMAETQRRIYQAYQEACQRSGVIDFADLLLKTCQVMQTDTALREHYQQRFRCLLVDEFQDTNTIQYSWLKLFAGNQSAVMIVGDDDQSIYGWRGARIENIQRFSIDFPGANVIRLEQNYRSTGTILKAANAIITRNAGRLGKNLWTAGGDGERITLYAAFNETDEAFYIVNRIREWHKQHGSYQAIAILYRSNAQSRVLEETLMQFGIPYRVYGGLRYFERAEIKDALGYLRLVMNHDDDPAFERIINTPTRDIGERTVNAIRDYAKSAGEQNTGHISLWQATLHLLEKGHFATRTATLLKQFMALIETITEKLATLPLEKQVEVVVHESGLINFYRQEKGEKSLARIENLEELVNAAYQFSQESVPEDMSPLHAFLAYAALENGSEQTGGENDHVQLMTLHSAKGLEFSVVFIAGCEEELFPHFRSIDNPKALEEERRLCYVGITRAMRKLYLTYAEVRRLYGKSVYHRPSRFLREIPAELIDEMRFRTKVSRPITAEAASSSSMRRHQDDDAARDFQIGSVVYHNIFGKGVILSTEGEGDTMKVKVRFDKFGTKILIASFLKIKK